MNKKVEPLSQLDSSRNSLLGLARCIENQMELVDFRPELHRPPEKLSELAFEPSCIEIHSAEDLLGVDCILECLLAAGLQDTRGFMSLAQSARTYLISNPVLLCQPWINSGGTVFEMHCELTGGFFDSPSAPSSAFVN